MSSNKSGHKKTLDKTVILLPEQSTVILLALQRHLQKWGQLEAVPVPAAKMNTVTVTSMTSHVHIITLGQCLPPH